MERHLHITGEDVDGNVAEDLLLPFWNGEMADFVWEDALIYMIMTDRFVNGDSGNDGNPPTLHRVRIGSVGILLELPR